MNRDLARGIAAQRDPELARGVATLRRFQPAFDPSEAAVEDDRCRPGRIPRNPGLAEPGGEEPRVDAAARRDATECERAVRGGLGPEWPGQLGAESEGVLSVVFLRWPADVNRHDLGASDRTAVLISQPAPDVADRAQDDRDLTLVRVNPPDATRPADPPVADAGEHVEETRRLGAARPPGVRKHEVAPAVGRRRRDRLGRLPIAADRPDLGPGDSHSGPVHYPAGQVLRFGCTAARDSADQPEQAQYDDGQTSRNGMGPRTDVRGAGMETRTCPDLPGTGV